MIIAKVAPRRAHNPKVVGSNPSPATKTRPSVSNEKLGVFAFIEALLYTSLQCILVQFRLVECEKSSPIIVPLFLEFYSHIVLPIQSLDEYRFYIKI